MLLSVSKELGKVCLRAAMSQAVTVGETVGLVRSGLWGLSGDQSQGVEELASSTWGLGTLRAD